MAWYHRVANIFRSDRHQQQVDREFAFHLQERTDDLIARGLPPARAAREARRRFGNRTAMAERTHDVDHLLWLDTVSADLRYAVRAIRNDPLVFCVAVVSMALGIGANVAIFSLINAVLLRPLPVRDPSQLVVVGSGKVTSADDVFTNPLWEQIRNVRGAFDGTFAFTDDNFNLSTGGPARRVHGYVVSGGMFATLGVAAATGRLFSPADDTRGCEPVVVLGNGFWRQDYGSAASAVGRTLYIDNTPFRIIGAVTSSFTSPQPGTGAQIFMPLCTMPLLSHDPGILDDRSSWMVSIMARLHGGVTLPQARAMLLAQSAGIYAATVPGDWGKQQQQDYLERQLHIWPAASGISVVGQNYRTALLVLMGVVGIVLLIACANVAQLLVARAAARQREMAIRLAIGASRGRLVRQLLTEGLVLGLTGAIAGLLFAHWASAVIIRGLVVAHTPVTLALPIDTTALSFTFGMAMLTGVVFGLAPAWGATRVDPQSAMKSGGRSVSSRGLSVRFGRALVVTQVALSLVLVAVGGLMLGSFRRLANTDPGFRVDGLTLVTADASSTGGNAASESRLLTELFARLRQLPGVSSVSASETTPLSHSGRNDLVRTNGYAPAKQMDALAWIHIVSPGYFATMGATVVAGRDFTDVDRSGNQRVVVIDESAVRRFFGGVNPIGRTLQFGSPRDSTARLTVVAVVRDAKYSSMDETVQPTAYIPLAQKIGDVNGGGDATKLHFEIRSAEATAVLAAEVATAAHTLSPAITLDFTTMNAQLAASVARPRLLAQLSTFFGALALLLALVGLYGIVSYSVALRRNEIGIRLALGAVRTRVVTMILGESTRLALVGVGIGVALTLATTRLVSSLLYGVTATDPVTIGAAITAMVATALVAAALPAWRAARIDPMGALREE
ncbi:MAG TPA: ABC transporter permease [Gemmatimonadales bacterium]|jgi:predicted permease